MTFDIDFVATCPLNSTNITSCYFCTSLIVENKSSGSIVCFKIWIIYNCYIFCIRSGNNSRVVKNKSSHLILPDKSKDFEWLFLSFCIFVNDCDTCVANPWICDWTRVIENKSSHLDFCCISNWAWNLNSTRGCSWHIFHWQNMSVCDNTLIVYCKSCNTNAWILRRICIDFTNLIINNKIFYCCCLVDCIKQCDFQSLVCAKTKRFYCDFVIVSVKTSDFGCVWIRSVFSDFNIACENVILCITLLKDCIKIFKTSNWHWLIFVWIIRNNNIKLVFNWINFFAVVVCECWNFKFHFLSSSLKSRNNGSQIFITVKYIFKLEIFIVLINICISILACWSTVRISKWIDKHKWFYIWVSFACNVGEILTFFESLNRWFQFINCLFIFVIMCECLRFCYIIRKIKYGFYANFWTIFICSIRENNLVYNKIKNSNNKRCCLFLANTINFTWYNNLNSDNILIFVWKFWSNKNWAGVCILILRAKVCWVDQCFLTNICSFINVCWIHAVFCVDFNITLTNNSDCHIFCCSATHNDVIFLTINLNASGWNKFCSKENVLLNWVLVLFWPVSTNNKFKCKFFWDIWSNLSFYINCSVVNHCIANNYSIFSSWVINILLNHNKLI